ncbi:putative membrane associated protein [Granulibacter bethesdensis]|nr:putative membrane associated protein [Granulibacter bethesdensis]
MILLPPPLHGGVHIRRASTRPEPVTDHQTIIYSAVLPDGQPLGGRLRSGSILPFTSSRMMEIPMRSRIRHRETHATERLGWLRATVLGANDGILSTASLMVGVASATSPGSGRGAILLAGLSALIAGAMSMAAGEYVSVSSQSDSERADLAREKKELDADWHGELDELTEIYRLRGLDAPLARQVAEQLMRRDPLSAHARDELGMTEDGAARPVQAALASAASFACGAALPWLAAALAPDPYDAAGQSTGQTSVIWTVSAVSLLALLLLGLAGAWAGNAPKLRAAMRVLLWGVLAMAATAITGHLFGGVVG